MPPRGKGPPPRAQAPAGQTGKGGKKGPPPRAANGKGGKAPPRAGASANSRVSGARQCPRTKAKKGMSMEEIMAKQLAKMESGVSMQASSHFSTKEREGAAVPLKPIRRTSSSPLSGLFNQGNGNLTPP